MEKEAHVLRDFAPWKAWIEEIRSYGRQTSGYLSGRANALILAQAMEDNGCGFIANLSAQNISLGGCFSWNSAFDWQFKTVEYFCPITCACSYENQDGSSCPRPFGKACDDLAECVTLNETHYCPDFNARVFHALLTYTFSSLPLAYSDFFLDILFFFAKKVVAPLKCKFILVFMEVLR